MAQSRRPELADVADLGRRLVYRAVDAALTEDKPLRRLLLDHLGADADALPAVSGSSPRSLVRPRPSGSPMII
jgi:hypothetical protein